jgi:hypothetical protein
LDLQIQGEHLFEEVLLSLAAGHRQEVEAQVSAFVDLYWNAGEGATADYDFSEMLAAAERRLPPADLELLRSMAGVIRGEMSLAAFIEEHGSPAQAERLARDLEDEETLALRQLKAGKLHSLADVRHMSTRPTAVRAALRAFEREYTALPREIQPTVHRLILEALDEREADVLRAAVRAAGTHLGRFPARARAEALQKMLRVAGDAGLSPDARDAAIQVLTTLYYHLKEEEKPDLLAGLQAIEADFAPTSLVRFLQRLSGSKETTVP